MISSFGSGTAGLRLTATSYIVLGLLDLAGEATPSDLKRVSQMSTRNFWSVPHTQLPSECARLACEGLLMERQEQGGTQAAQLPPGGLGP
jgi:PadR family transcriptional regulator, regulatory protein AphA